METVFAHDLDPDAIRAWVGAGEPRRQSIFLSNITTANGRYLEHFVFDPGLKTARSHYSFPQEKPTRRVWDNGSTSGVDMQPQGGNLRCDWGSGATQCLKSGNGTTERRKMTCNKMNTEGSITTSDNPDQNWLINKYGMDHSQAKHH